MKRANFHLKRSKFKVTGGKNHRNLASCLFTGGRSGAGAQAPTASYAIVRPSSLSTPEHETLGNWTDGRMSCRHSAPKCFLVSKGKNTDLGYSWSLVTAVLSANNKMI